MRFLITLLFCTFFAALSAQNKTGVWYGAIVFEPDGVREVDSEPRIRVDKQAGRIVNVPPIYAGSMSLSKSRTYTKAKFSQPTFPKRTFPNTTKYNTGICKNKIAMKVK